MKKPKKETNDTTIKNIRNLFRLRKENKVIKDRIVTDIRNIFEYGDVRNIFMFDKKLNQVKTDWLEIFGIFLSMKKKKIIINQ